MSVRQVITSGWSSDHPTLSLEPTRQFAFMVADTGIGIAPEKQKLILRGVPASGRRDEPKIWRYGARARHQS